MEKVNIYDVIRKEFKDIEEYIKENHNKKYYYITSPEIHHLVAKYYKDEKLVGMLWNYVNLKLLLIDLGDFYYGIGLCWHKLDELQRQKFMGEFGFDINIIYGLIQAGNSDGIESFYEEHKEKIKKGDSCLHGGYINTAIVKYGIKESSQEIFHKFLEYLKSKIFIGFSDLMLDATQSNNLKLVEYLIAFDNEKKYSWQYIKNDYQIHAIHNDKMLKFIIKKLEEQK